LASYWNKRGVSLAYQDPSNRYSSARHVALMAEMRNAYKKVDGKYEAKRPLGRPNTV
jgi:hypothetical protein